MAVKRLRIALIAIALAMIAVLGVGASRSRSYNGSEIIDPTCTSSSPCIEYDNKGSGPGIRGTSLGGNGLSGSTAVKSTSSASGREGVIGNDISTSGTFDAGVRGLSVRGTAVAGQSTGGSGVSGTSSSGDAVVGSANARGVVGSSSSNFGVLGITGGSFKSIAAVQGKNNSLSIAVRAKSSVGAGNLFVGNNSRGTDVFVVPDGAPGITIAGSTSVSGNAIIDGLTTSNTLSAGSSAVSIGLLETGVVLGLSNGPAATGVRANGFGGNLFVGNNSHGTDSFVADDSGNLTIAGQIFTAGTCSSGCVHDPKLPGARVVTYAPREADPTMEDVGEGHLVSGRAYVALDPTFANVINQRANYLVFITPEGDNRGLYVTQKSLAGFAVRESQGGHSTLAFSYRIVAKPFGESAPRLARVTLRPQRKHSLPPAPRPVHLLTVPKQRISTTFERSSQ